MLNMQALRIPQIQSADPWFWKVPLVSFILLLAIWSLGINQDLFYSLNHLNHYTGSFIWANLTIFGDALVGLSLCLLLFHRNRRVLWTVVLSGLVVAVLINSLKPMFGVDRPPSVLPHEFFTIIGPAHLRNSFPSGHTATIFAFVGAVLLALPRQTRQIWGWLWISFATLVGVSRIMVGVHWPLDIAAGALVGWLAAWAGWWLATRWHWGETHAGHLWLKSILVLGAVALLLFHKMGYPAAHALQLVLAAAALYSVLHKPWRQLQLRFKPHLRKVGLSHQKYPTLRMVCCLHKNFRQ